MRRIGMVALLLMAGCIGAGEADEAIGHTDGTMSFNDGDATPRGTAFSVEIALAATATSTIRITDASITPLQGDHTRPDMLLAPGEEGLLVRVPAEAVVPGWTARVGFIIGDPSTRWTAWMEIGPWDATQSSTVHVTFDVPRERQLLVQSVEGPAIVHLPPDATDSGAITWPSGRSVPLENFAHNLHVPETHPALQAGREVLYRVDAPHARWFLDGEVVGTTPTLAIETPPGRHEILLEVTDRGATDTLRMIVTGRQEWVGHGIAAGPIPREAGMVPVGADYDFEIVEAARIAVLFVTLTGDNLRVDVDLYLIGPDGAILDERTTGEYLTEQAVTASGPLEPGAYKLRVLSRNEVVPEFDVRGIVDY